MGLESTGDPIHNAAWTALGVPAISIPLAVEGPPVGLQITSRWGAEELLLGVACTL